MFTGTFKLHIESVYSLMTVFTSNRIRISLAVLVGGDARGRGD